MVGSGLKYGRRVVKEQTVGVVRNHAGGTRKGVALSSRRERTKARKRDDGATGRTDFAAGYDGGGSLDNRKRGNPASQPGR
jgi:hypothetical protein